MDRKGRKSAFFRCFFERQHSFRVFLISGGFWKRFKIWPGTFFNKRTKKFTVPVKRSFSLREDKATYSSRIFFTVKNNQLKII